MQAARQILRHEKSGLAAFDDAYLNLPNLLTDL